MGMTENRVVYALKKYKYYERRRTMMYSLNYEEINSCFEKEMKRLYNETGLVIIQYELGKWNMKKHFISIITISEDIKRYSL